MAVTCQHCGALINGNVCEYCGIALESPPPVIIYKSDKSESTVSLPLKKNSTVIVIVVTVLILFFSLCVAKKSESRHYDTRNLYTVTEDSEAVVEKKSQKATESPVYNPHELHKETGTFPSGTYQIGVDIPEGIYVFIPDLAENHGVQGVYSDPECNNQISSAYVHFDGTRIAEISGKGYLKFSWATAYNLDMHPEIVNNPYKTDGMFIVGRDIEEGTYHLESPPELFGDMSEYAEWYIYSSINAVGALTKESGVLTSCDYPLDNISDEITLNDGEYLELRHCIISDD